MFWFVIGIIFFLFLWMVFEVQDDVKKRQKEYDKNMAFDEKMKIYAVGGHWVDHKGVGHYDPELEKLNNTPERMALRQKMIDEARARLEESERIAKKRGW